MKKLRIFAASPADVATERAKLARVVETLKPLADSIDVVLEVVDWRQVVPDVGRPQQIIFDQIQPTSWEVFIGILWHRFGTPPVGADPHTQREYLSGTEEEWLSGILRGIKLLYYQLLMSTDRRSNILRSESSGAPDF